MWDEVLPFSSLSDCSCGPYSVHRSHVSLQSAQLNYMFLFARRIAANGHGLIQVELSLSTANSDSSTRHLDIVETIIWSQSLCPSAHPVCVSVGKNVCINQKKCITAPVSFILCPPKYSAAYFSSSLPYITGFHLAFLNFDTFHLKVIVFNLPQVSPGLSPLSEELSCSSILLYPSEL